MTNPSDPWAPRPEDAPTEHFGPPGKSGFDQPSHTTEYTEAYGRGDEPTMAYPSSGPSEPWSPPPNGTREFPTYESRQYGSGYGAPPGQGEYVPPGAPYQPPKKSNTGLWVLLGLGVIALIAVAGVVAGVLLTGGNSSSNEVAGTSARLTAVEPTGTPPSGRPTPSGLPSIPGLGGIDALGATMGIISANDAGTLTLDSLSGAPITVHTDANTQVVSLSGAAVADLPIGDMVVVQGDKAADGSIQAKIIVSTALPGAPR